MRYLKYLELAAVTDYFLFHNTQFYKAYSILKTDSFHLSLSETNESEAQMGSYKPWYISFARTVSSGYIADRSSGLRSINYPILFVFDKRKLKTRNAIFKPVQYFTLGLYGRQMGSGREAEERMFYSDPVFKGVSKAIKEIRVYIHTSDMKDSYISYLRKLVILAKQRKIPVKFFTETNKQGYLRGVEKKEDRELILSVMDQNVPLKKGISYIAMGRSKIVKKKNKDWYSPDWIDQLGELIRYDSLDKLSKRTRSRITFDYNIDLYSYYKNDIHNFRTDSIDIKQRFDALLKKTKSKSIKEFFSKLDKKWNALLNRRTNNTTKETT